MRGGVPVADYGEEAAATVGDGAEPSPAATAAPMEAARDGEDSGEASTPGPELRPLTPADKPTRRPMRRKLTDAQKKERRNAMLREKRARERAQRAAEAALGVPRAEGSAAAAAARPDATADAGGADPNAMPATDGPDKPVDPKQLEIMLGLGLDIGSRTLLPVRWGGGPLSEDERRLLGGVWAEALAPYLTGPSSLIGLALVATVQVFAVRAMQQQGAAAPDDAGTRTMPPATPDAPSPGADSGAPSPQPAPSKSGPVKPAAKVIKVPKFVRD